jgi:hypothetical protein
MVICHASACETGKPYVIFQGGSSQLVCLLRDVQISERSPNSDALPFSAPSDHRAW